MTTSISGFVDKMHKYLNDKIKENAYRYLTNETLIRTVHIYIVNDISNVIQSYEEFMDDMIKRFEVDDVRNVKKMDHLRSLSLHRIFSNLIIPTPSPYGGKDVHQLCFFSLFEIQDIIFNHLTSLDDMERFIEYVVKFSFGQILTLNDTWDACGYDLDELIFLTDGLSHIDCMASLNRVGMNEDDYEFMSQFLTNKNFEMIETVDKYSINIRRWEISDGK